MRVRVGIFAGAIVALFSALGASNARSDELPQPECDYTAQGVCNTVIIPAWCLDPNDPTTCDEEVHLDIFGRRL